VKLEDWHNTHNNQQWVCKPDASCGIEICSPVSENFLEIHKVIDFLSKDKNIKIDERCSFHVHVDISDLSENELVSVLSWWIKFEHLFFDAMPDCRKMNKYCQCIGIIDLFQHDEIVDNKIINKLGATKYLSCNTFHFCKKNRKTIEFRIADHFACLDQNYATNWVLLLTNFISIFSQKEIPKSLCWENPSLFLDFLSNIDIELRNWFFYRVKKNINSKIQNWDSEFRNIVKLEFNNIFKSLQLDKYCIDNEFC
jgi:hypothetical protein